MEELEASCRKHDVLHSFCISTTTKEDNFFRTCHGDYLDIGTDRWKAHITDVRDIPLASEDDGPWSQDDQSESAGGKRKR
ncbi:hypothetical protein C3L33_05284, partial [Rhododendron williamsianum]